MMKEKNKLKDDIDVTIPYPYPTNFDMLSSNERYNEIMLGVNDVIEGKVSPLFEVDERIRKKFNILD